MTGSSKLTRRLRLAVFALSFALVSSSGARAADAIGKDAGPVDVELPPIIAPMTMNGRLEGYAYITISLAPVDRGKVLAIRDKLAFLQDAFLRELNKGTILKADDPKALDTGAIKPRLIARMNQILPPDTVAELKFEQVVIALTNPDS
jgi:hypothetical protein